MIDNTTLINLISISKKYNGRTVIDDVSHEFKTGTSVAFMGHNGCGKSTLLRIIARLTKPTSGEVHYNSPVKFSYVPEKFMPLKISARVYLERIGSVQGIAHNSLMQTIKSLADDFFVSEMLGVPMYSLSKGTLQKIGVIQAMLEKPDVLLLDEPLSGQDRSSQKVFVQKVNELRNQKTMVLMSCHEQALVNAISEQVYTISDGKLVEGKCEEKRIYTLLLGNPKELPVPQEFELYGDGYRLKLEQSNTQTAIMHLIREGWTLKGMYEDDNTTDKI